MTPRLMLAGLSRNALRGVSSLRRCLTPDLVGMRRSVKSPATNQLEVAAKRRFLQVDSPHVVGIALVELVMSVRDSTAGAQ